MSNPHWWKQRFILEGGANLADQAPRVLPAVRVHDRAFIELRPSRVEFARNRDLARQPLHVLLMQDVHVNGERRFLRVRVASRVSAVGRVTFPENVGPELQLLEVPDERWGTFRKVIAVISEKPIDSDLLGDEEELTPRELESLAKLLWQGAADPYEHGVAGLSEGRFGLFEIWQFAYRVEPRAASGLEGVAAR